MDFAFNKPSEESSELGSLSSATPWAAKVSFLRHPSWAYSRADMLLKPRWLTGLALLGAHGTVDPPRGSWPFMKVYCVVPLSPVL